MSLTMVVFVATVLAVATAFWLGARRAGITLQPVLSVVGFWIAVPGTLVGLGLLDRYDPPPPPALLVFGALLIGTVVLAFGSVGTRFLNGLPLVALVGYQAFRIPVEWVLHQLYLEGTVPIQMTWAGRNFDILSGLGAVIVAVGLRHGRRPIGLLAAWNVMGIGLLANIVVVAVLSTPSVLRQFPADPPNLLPSTLPWVWLPSFLVPAALFGHLLVFRALARRDIARP